MFQFKIETVASKSDTSLGSDNGNDSSISRALENLHQTYPNGSRVRCENHLGTVRYIGPVSPHTGLWLGIEWDDPSRGRHDGSVNGIEYFQSSKPGAASFVRPDKVKKCKKITEAIHERYGYDPDVINSLKDIAGGLEHRKKVDFSQLQLLNVSSREISDLERPGTLAEFSPNIEFLSISDNLVTDWEAIGNVCIGLNHLKGLDVSENPLGPVPESLSAVLETVFQKLEHVIMGKIKYDWNQVLKASAMWKNIINFQVQYNQISVLSPPLTTLLHLKSLDLGGNQISSWDEIIKLNGLTELEYLNLSGNRIVNIRFPPKFENDENAASTSMFSNLIRLNLSENCIPDWISINELNKLKNLKELRIDTNPFLDSDVRINNRQMIIARIARLQKLDGVDINRQERRDAELDYIKKFASKWKSEGGLLQFSEEHPRYASLIKIYGQSEGDELNSGIKSMKSSLINVQLIPEDSSIRPVTKKLLQTMSVQKLKMLIQRLFHVPGAHIEIKVVSGRNASISFTMENDFFDLSTYSIEDGDQLYLHW